MSFWIWIIIFLVLGLIAYDMYRSRYVLYGAFGWGKKQGEYLRKQKYKNTKKQ